MRIKNLPSILSMDGSQDALVIEQTDGSEDKSRKVSPAQIKQYVLGNSIDDIYSVMGQNGAKNLIPYPYYETTKEVNGIVITDNGDGTITVNGTASANTTLFRYLNNDTAIEIPLERRKYKLTFGTDQGSNGFHLGDFRLVKTDSTTQTVNVTGDTIIDNTDGNYIGINAMSVYVAKDKVINNVTIYPMLRLEADTDNTYQPYAMTNKQLTDELDTAREQISQLNEDLGTNKRGTMVDLATNYYRTPYTTPTDGYIVVQSTAVNAMGIGRIKDANNIHIAQISAMMHAGSGGYETSVVYVKKGMNVDAYRCDTNATVYFYPLVN